MSAVIAAVFADHDRAVDVRTRLVSDGFPTDRVQLTSRSELGQAQVVPEESVTAKLVQHFLQPFPSVEGSDATAQGLAREVMAGRAVIVVHPRGDVETHRAFELLEQFAPLGVHQHDLDNQTMERAAAPSRAES